MYTPCTFRKKEVKRKDRIQYEKQTFQITHLEQKIEVRYLLTAGMAQTL
jgi:hypothetical protein